MSLIERYIHDVSRRLPRKLRDDVEQELRSSLEEAAETIADNATDEEREQREAEILRQFGPPAKLAASYRTGPRWLIGPDFYPAFVRVIKIAALIVFGIFAVVVIGQSFDEPNPLLEIGKGLVMSNIISEFVSVLGWIVVVFWIIQLSSSRSRGAVTAGGGVLGEGVHYCGPDEDTWDPRSLPKVNDPDRADRASLVVEIVIMVGLIALVRFFPTAVGASIEVDGERGWVSLLGPGFTTQRAMFIAAFVSTIILNVLVLRHNRWTIPLRSFEIVVDGVFIAALWPLATSGDILASTVSDLIEDGWSAASAEELAQRVFPFLDNILQVIAAMIIVGVVIHIVVRGVKLARRWVG